MPDRCMVEEYGPLYREIRLVYDADPSRARVLVDGLSTEAQHGVLACAQAEQHELYDTVWDAIDAGIEAELMKQVEIGKEALADLDPVEACNALFRFRHRLPNDILRSLQSIWTCASAARFGQPYERFWVDNDEVYAEHNTAECEDDSHPERGPGYLIGQFHDETGLLDVYRGDPAAIDDTEDVQPFLAWIADDQQRATAWAGIRERYGRDDRALIAGVVKQHAPLFSEVARP